jgi:prepilin-type N-terminal cleavage/methylation domain-containing protein
MVTAPLETAAPARRRGRTPAPRRDTGFSMFELIIVMAVIAILGFIAVPSIRNTVVGMRLNMAADRVTATLRETRELAMSKNRNHRLRFVGNNEIVVERWCTAADVAAAASRDLDCNVGSDWNSIPAAKVVFDPSMTLPDGIEFRRTTAGSPEGFGVSPTDPIDFTAAVPVMFTPTGFLVSATNPDAIANGTIYIADTAHPNVPGRAISILGSVGRVRTWTFSTVAGAGPGVWRR